LFIGMEGGGVTGIHSKEGREDIHFGCIICEPSWRRECVEGKKRARKEGKAGLEGSPDAKLAEGAKKGPVDVKGEKEKRTTP